MKCGHGGADDSGGSGSAAVIRSAGRPHSVRRLNIAA